jgi:predicted Zn finger-like uncharacterized protein
VILAEETLDLSEASPVPMRFVCDSCRAQYMISDEKVGARGVKVRCKKCGHVIHVRRPDSEAEGAVAALQDSEAPAPPAETPTEENNIFSGVDEDEIGAAFDQALGGEGTHVTNPFQPSEDSDSTRVMDEESVKRFAEMSQGGTPTPVPPPAASANYEWFVAVDEVQTGPLGEARVKELWDRGEIGPDSLTWRQGLADWIPLSEVGELAALLAPRPSRPIFAPAVTPVPASVMTVPVESAFSAGGMTRTVRSEVPVATATLDSGFRPSATAALASLVKDEIEALNKPPPPKEPPPSAPRSILEVPEEPVKRTGPSATAMPVARPGANGAPTVPTPFAYRPAPAASSGSRKGLTLGLIGIAGVVAVLVVVVAMQTFRKPAPVTVLPPPPPPPVTTPIAPPTVSGTAGPTAVASTAPTPSPSVPVKAPPPGLAKAPTPVPAVEAPPRRGTGSRRTGSKIGGASADSTLEGPAKDTIEASHPRNKADDLFDEVFGTPDGKKAAPSGDKGKKTAYVPPAPGVTDVPEKVGDGDIMSVVLANKSSMVRCVDEQKSRDPNLHGTLVMHWVIQTSGKTTNVGPVTEAYKSSYFATCMTGLVKTWQFPKHRFAPGQAVDFPFKF